MPMTEKKLKARDAKRDLGAELLASVLEMKAGKKGRVHKIALSEVTQARAKSGLSQSQFAPRVGARSAQAIRSRSVAAGHCGEAPGSDP